MRLNSYTTPVLYNKQVSKNKNIISFGHYLDDQKSERQTTLGQLNQRIRDTKAAIEQQKAANANEVTALDRTMTQKSSRIKALVAEITRLTGIDAQRTKTIGQLRQQGQRTEQEIRQGKWRDRRLKEKQGEILRTIEQDELTAQTTRRERFKTLMTELGNLFQRQSDRILSGPKNTLIQNIINPTVSESEGCTAKIPSGIFFECGADDSDAPKRVFEWVVKRTNSNYAIIDAADFDNKSGLVRVIKHVAERSKAEFDSTNNRTFTFVDNFDSWKATDADNEALRHFLGENSEEYHNTVVVSTKDSAALPSLISEDGGFPIKIKLDQDFLQDGRIGYKSILNELRDLILTGKNLFFKSFESMFRSLV